MDTTEVQNYLNRAYYLDKRIDSLQEELLQIESRLLKVTSHYDTIGGGNQGSFEHLLDKLHDYRKALNYEVDQLVDAKRDIKKTIDTLPDDVQKLVLTKRYINYQKYEEIASDLHYSVRQIRNIRDKGIKNISLNFPSTL